MLSIFSRTELLVGKTNLDHLQKQHVAIFGVGGVGGNCIEALARTGIGEITIVDHDIVSLTNLNRQIIALHSTIGKSKVEVMKTRLLEINPAIKIHALATFLDKETIHTIDFHAFDYVVDAIDTISAKLLLIEKCHALDIPLISCMGIGNKLVSDGLCITTIEKTSYCPLAKVMRHELKKRSIHKVEVLYSPLKPLKPLKSTETSEKREVPGSICYVVNIAGLMLAENVIHNILKIR
ncbi:MAG: ThiF family adenylyltransferase [Breznakia sp.]